jgi:hypothetical protein
VRKRDPRRLLAGHRRAEARVQIVEVEQSDQAEEGAVGSRQEAKVTLPRAELERIWSPEYLERLAGTYWRFLTRVSLGLLRVHYGEDFREIVLLRKPFTLLRFDAPEYDTGPCHGTVTWRIQRGLLVAPSGRTGGGYLRLTVRRPDPDEGGPEITGTVCSEVVNFYPMIAGWGWFARVGRVIYRETQLRLHIVLTHAFLRSLARLDLAPSRVGALRAPPT